MYIIVVGGGEVGFHLSRTLLGDGHEVLILEKNGARCEALAEELGSVVARGDGCEVATLEEVGTGRADILIAVTGDDEDNLVACQVAKHRFHVPRTIARIKNPRHATIFNILGVDATVSSTDLILAHIGYELPSHGLIPLLPIKGGGQEFEVVDVKIPPESAAVGKKLRDLHLARSGSVLLIVVGPEKGPRVPTRDTVLEAGDEVVALTRAGTEDALRAVLTGS